MLSDTIIAIYMADEYDRFIDKHNIVVDKHNKLCEAVENLMERNAKLEKSIPVLVPIPDIEPCPFCGINDIYIRKEGPMFKTFYYEATCNNVECNVKPTTALFKTKKEAIASWNKRSY